MIIDVYGYADPAEYGDEEWPFPGECSRCGDHHFNAGEARAMAAALIAGADLIEASRG